MIQIFKSLKNSKGKLFLLFFSILFFLFILFPFEDLSDVVTQKILDVSNQSVYLQFQDLHVKALPQPQLQLEKVFIETLKTPSLTAKNISITPSLTAIITQKPFGRIEAEGIFKGNLSLQTQKGIKTESGLDRTKIDILAEKINMKEVREWARWPFLMSGQLNMKSQVQMDLSFQEQPEVDMSISIKNLDFPATTINTAGGPLNLPDLRLSQVELKGRWVGGQLIIESSQLGQPNDEVYGTVRGKVALRLDGPQMRPEIGSYSFDIDLTTRKSFQDRASLYLFFIDAHRKTQGNLNKYRFRVSGNSFRDQPQIGALQ